MNNLMLEQITIADHKDTSHSASEFHIHIDAHQLAQGFEDFLLGDLGFWNTDFSGHPVGVLHFETPRHLTYKTKDAKNFKTVFDNVTAYLKGRPDDISGYVEGEFIPLDINIKEKPFDPTVPVPCQFELTTLAAGTFREDEIHITLDRDRSDPRLIDNLRSMGFFSAYMDKSFGTVEILTAQGTRQIIQQLLSQVLTYLNTAGGAINCSVKEERILRWWLSDPDIKLPPVIQFINQGTWVS
jgi:hypothetical protein